MKCLLFGVLLSSALLLSGCGAKKVKTSRVVYPPAHRTKSSPPTARLPQIGETETGVASWYGEPYHGRRAANGEIYDMEQLTAAHRTLPFNTWVRVHNLVNDRSVDVRITDRGPFVGERIIDLSRAAARQIEMIGPGVARVELTILQAPAPLPALRDFFGVQVGAFRDPANARKLRDRLAQLYGQARTVQRADSPDVWRVVVGGCDSMEKAGQLAAQLRGEFSQCYVVRTDWEPGVTPACGTAPPPSQVNSERPTDNSEDSQ